MTLLRQSLLMTLLTLCHLSVLANIKIGVAGPLSGPYAAFGEQLYKGAELAVENINRSGGVNGQKLQLVREDDACEPKQAVNVANKAIDRDGVDAILGHFCSSSTIPASEIYADEGILMITPASTNPRVTERGLDTVFRTCGRDDQQGVVAANFILQNLKAKRVAVLHDKDTYGKGLADATRAHLKQHQLNTVIYEGITRGEKDFNALVTKLKSEKVDAIYFGGLHTEAGPLVRQAREQGITAPFISGDGIVTDDFITAVGGPRFAKNVYMTFGKDPRKSPTGQKIVAQYRQKNYEPEGYTLYAYATIEVISQAMQSTKSTDGIVLGQWLRNNTVQTILGPKAWDNKGDLVATDYVMYSWDDKGNYAEVAQ